MPPQLLQRIPMPVMHLVSLSPPRGLVAAMLYGYRIAPSLSMMYRAVS